MAAQRARQYAMLAAEATSPAAIDQLAEDVQRLALAYPQRPVSQILPDLAETQDTLFTLLERRQQPTQSRDLHFLAGITSGLLAQVSHDMADPHSAMLQARTAVLCADQSDHPGLQAWLRGLQSLVAYWAGRYAEAVRYAEAGREYATQAGGTSAVWLPVSAARAYAALGNSEQAKAAITEAEDTWSRVRPDEMDEIGGICTFNQPRTLYYASDALAWLPGEADATERYALRAVQAYSDRYDPAWAFGDQAGSHTNLAIARVASGELDATADALAPYSIFPPISASTASSTPSGASTKPSPVPATPTTPVTSSKASSTSRTRLPTPFLDKAPSAHAPDHHPRPRHHSSRTATR
ncbi:XRE family transcriptional regulator [Micromonospora sp. DT53]|uniref:XRE family transcriptional regulator n=1 Tax=Micromonospora sp. DT53 TaxID=3393444 RepID=UPI003CED2699